jgi:nucleoside-diphosphate-sugar epimerase
MQRILVSGYTGFVGTNLVKKLRGKYIYGLDIQKNDSVDRHFTWDSLKECTDQDCIIHLAGKAHDKKNISNEHEYFVINVGLTQKLFQYFLESQASKFIFFSTVKASSDSVCEDILKEDVIPNPETPYGRSKLEAERFILDALDKWKDKEKLCGRNNKWKEVYILRPSMIYGPGNKGNLNLLINIQQKGIPWLLGAFENKRSFCFIDNILFVVKEILERNIEPGTYQVADDESLSTNQLIELINDFYGKKGRIWKIPKALVKFTAKIGDVTGLPLNSERLKKLTENYVVSNKKIKNALGVEKMPFTAISGLKLTIESLTNT